MLYKSETLFTNTIYKLVVKIFEKGIKTYNNQVWDVQAFKSDLLLAPCARLVLTLNWLSVIIES